MGLSVHELLQEGSEDFFFFAMARHAMRSLFPVFSTERRGAICWDEEKVRFTHAALARVGVLQQ